MNCGELNENLELYELGALAGEEKAAFEAHLQSCPECRGKVRETEKRIEQFKQAMRADAKHDPDLQELRLRVREEFVAGRMAEISSLRRRIFLRLAAIIVICVCLPLAWQAVKGRTGPDKCACRPWMEKGIVSVAATDVAYPLVVDKVIYVLAAEKDGNHLVAMDRRIGSHLWKTPFSVSGLPASDSSRIYVWNSTAPGDLRLTALDHKTGATAWVSDERAFPVQARLPHIAVAGKHLVIGNAGRLIALSADNGRREWSRTISDDGLVSAPAADSVHVYAASRKMLIALDPGSGDVRWENQHDPDGYSVIPPLAQAGNGIVVVGRAIGPGRGQVQCFSADTGAFIWKQETDTPKHLLAAGDRVFVRGGQVQALDAGTGQAIWSVPMGGCSPVTVAGDRVYVVEGRERNGIFALEKNTGERVWDRQLISSCSGFVVAGKMGYLNTQDGVLRAIALKGRSS